MTGGRFDVRRLEAGSLRTLLERTADGLLVVDREGVICYANPAAGALLSRPVDQLLGTAFGLPLVRGEKAEIEVPGEGAEGAARVCELRVAECDVDASSVFLVSLRDESERELARREASAASQAKTDLLRTIAHEVRAPLGVVVGSLSMILEDDRRIDQRRRQQLVEAAFRRAKDLQRLIENLLTSASLESGRMEPRPEPVDLRVVAREAATRAGSQAPGDVPAVPVALDLPPQPIIANVDRRQVGIILDNLLNNAIKYSEDRAAVQLALRTRGPEAELSVTDRGLGIPSDQQARIFEAFRRGSSEAAARRPGSGLGLSIASRLAGLNRGTLALAESVPGRGSRFVLRLPLGPSSE